MSVFEEFAKNLVEKGGPGSGRHPGGVGENAQTRKEHLAAAQYHQEKAEEESQKLETKTPSGIRVRTITHDSPAALHSEACNLHLAAAKNPNFSNSNAARQASVAAHG